MSILEGYKPIGVYKQTLILYKLGKLYKYIPELDVIQYCLTITTDYKELYFSKIKMLSRFLRLGIRASIVSGNILIIYLNKSLIEIDLKQEKIISSVVFNICRPLYISIIEGVQGFTSSVVFGAYLGNDKRKPVSIYRRVKSGKWEAIFTFKQGEINHIHNIVPDIYNKCVWILTGDFDTASAIWKSTDDFKSVKPVLRNNQNFRACVAFPSEKGLIYATDTPFKANSIRILLCKDDKYESLKICDIHGSSIYGCKNNGRIYFSTTVEPNGSNNILCMMFSNKKGKGIDDYYSYIYEETDEGFKPIYKARKDLMPLIPFQYGTLQFPQIEFNLPFLPIYHTSTKKYDLSTLLLKNINKL